MRSAALLALAAGDVNAATTDAFDCRGGFVDRGTTSALGCAAQLSP